MGPTAAMADGLKDRPLDTTCTGDLSYYPGEAARNCCYQCPSGLSPTQPCPQGPDHCKKQCDPDYYINEDGKCTACVTCLPGLVEKAPCSGNSPRICECQPGMYCSTPAVNSCARCSEKNVVKFPDTAQKNTICELPSPGSGPNGSNPDDCKTLTSRTTPQAIPTLESPANDSVRSLLPKQVTDFVNEGATKLVKVPESSSSKASMPSPDPGNAEMNMTLKLPPPGTVPDISTSENSMEPARNTVSGSRVHALLGGHGGAAGWLCLLPPVLLEGLQEAVPAEVSPELSRADLPAQDGAGRFLSY